MSWRTGELWLDTDVLWFREGSRASPLAGFAPVAMPSFGGAPGLAASRQRRAARKRRKHARKLQAAALVLAPAAVIPIAALRSSGGQPATREDPPSLTFRLDLGQSAELVDPVPLHRSVGASARVRVAQGAAHRSIARVESYPPVVWHHATSEGLPYNGTLIDGTQLPIDGANWVTWNPVTNSVPNEPDRLYGNEHTIRTVISVINGYRAAHPGAPRVVVGDISRLGGGPMTDEHASHQNGLDVDIYYPRLDGKLREPLSPDEIDRRLAQDLLDRFVAVGAQMIFVGYSTDLHGPSGVVIPYPNHDNHMHVRFPPPGG
ncbi:MAG TPA: penicillin-insensitive murein endopeptidase [Gaiellaceae bacterium]|jgi:hypothetical protein